MTQTISKHAKSCCSAEKDRLMEELRKCDFCSTSLEERHECFREAARESGERSRECITA